jgi:hypothetical protein
MFIIMAGNPIDGFKYIGPFATSDEATTWGEDNEDRITENEAAAGAEWWVLPLESQ